MRQIGGLLGEWTGRKLGGDIKRLKDSEDGWCDRRVGWVV